MRQDTHQQIFLRLKDALQAKGALNAVRRLEIAQTLFPQQDSQAIRSLALRHCREYDLDPNWVLFGIPGSPLSSPGVARTPVLAMDTIHPKTGRWRICEIERISLPPAILSPTRFVTRMDTRTLEPRIRMGAYLVVDTGQELPPARAARPEMAWADEAVPFAIDLLGEGLTVRLTRYNGRTDTLELEALEREMPPLALSRAASAYRIIGRVVWVCQAL